MISHIEDVRDRPARFGNRPSLDGVGLRLGE